MLNIQPYTQPRWYSFTQGLALKLKLLHI